MTEVQDTLFRDVTFGLQSWPTDKKTDVPYHGYCQSVTTLPAAGSLPFTIAERHKHLAAHTHLHPESKVSNTDVEIQGGSNMTETNCDLLTHK